MTKVEGSVRVDLLGGTLDLNPINLIIPNVVTLNVATSLKAKVILEKIDFVGVEIISKDYHTENRFKTCEFTQENLLGDHFKELTFVCQILDYFHCHSGVRMTLESGSPAGSGLGGSSSMGVTLYKALCQFTDTPFDPIEAIVRVNGIESRILNSGPAGYQDYYPAMFGGVLALLPELGRVEVKQLFSPELKEYLEERLTLVYSGKTRLSGINNWEVYKGFFDKVPAMREGLQKIADLSMQAYKTIESGDLGPLADLISQEGYERKELFPGIVSPGMESLYNELRGPVPELGLKVCGAGGGGCFLLVHGAHNKELVRQKVVDSNMSVLEFEVEPPL